MYGHLYFFINMFLISLVKLIVISKIPIDSIYVILGIKVDQGRPSNLLVIIEK